MKHLKSKIHILMGIAERKNHCLSFVVGFLVVTFWLQHKAL